MSQLQISPNEAWVVYRADQDVLRQRDLYAVSTTGAGSPIRLTGPQDERVRNYEITPDSSRVIYGSFTPSSPGSLNGSDELFSVPIDGSSAGVRLNDPLMPGGDISNDYAISPDGQTVVFIADPDGDDLTDVYRVSADGSSAPVALTPVSLQGSVGPVDISPDGSTVVVRAAVGGNPFELYKIPLDGSAGPTKLSGPLIAAGSVDEFRISPDSTYAVYRADAFVNGRQELFSVRLDLPPSATLLSGAAPSFRFVTTFEVDSLSNRVVYSVFETTGLTELYSVPLDASQAPLRLDQSFPSGQTLGRLTPDGSTVVYRSPLGLRSSPIDGSVAPVTLDGVADEIELTPDGSRVVYTLNDVLFSVRTDGSAPPVRLADPRLLPNPGPPPVRELGGIAPPRPTRSTLPNPTRIGAFEIASDSQTVAFSAGSLQFQRELRSVPVDGSSTSVPLSGPSEIWTDITLASTASGSAVFFGNLNSAGVIEAFSAPLDGASPVKTLNSTLALSSVGSGQVRFVDLSPDGSTVVYHDLEGFKAVSVRGGGGARLLSPPGLSPLTGTVSAFANVAFSPDSRFVFMGFGLDELILVYRAPLDGTQPAALLEWHETFETTLDFLRATPDGTRVVYVTSMGGFFSRELYSLPTDGSARSQALASWFDGPAPVRITPDSSRIIYETRDSYFNSDVLFSVGVDVGGSQRLADPSKSVEGSYQDAFDGVVYQVRDVITGAHELLTSPYDGSSPETVIASNLQPDSGFRVSPDGTHVAFVRESPTDVELCYGPIDDGPAAVVLTTLPTTVQFGELLFDPSGARLVYRANADSPGSSELYSMPVDASQAPVKIHPSFTPSGGVPAPSSFGSPAPNFRITPDGKRVVYRADARQVSLLELSSSPIDGVGPTHLLHDPLVSGQSVHDDFRLLERSPFVLYRGGPDAVNLPLWSSRTDSAALASLRSGPFVHPTEVEEDFLVTPQEDYVIYIADQETDGVEEVFAYRLKRTTRAPLPELPARMARD